MVRSSWGELRGLPPGLPPGLPQLQEPRAAYAIHTNGLGTVS